MALTVKCSRCGQTLRLPDGDPHRLARCGHCAAQVEVPAGLLDAPTAPPAWGASLAGLAGDSDAGAARPASRVNLIFVLVLGGLVLAGAVAAVAISLSNQEEKPAAAAPSSPSVAQAPKFEDQLMPPPPPPPAGWDKAAPPAPERAPMLPDAAPDGAPEPPPTALPSPRPEVEAPPDVPERSPTSVRRSEETEEKPPGRPMVRGPGRDTRARPTAEPPTAPADTPGSAAAVAELVATASNPNKAKSTRVEALKALAVYGPQAAAAIPATYAFLADPEIEVRKIVYNLLYRIGPASIPTLQKLVRNPANYAWPGPAISAIQVLGAMGPAAREAAPDLVKAARLSDLAFDHAVAALTRIRPDPHLYVPDMLKMLKRGIPHRGTDPVRFSVRLPRLDGAIRLLGQAGPEAREAVPDLVAILNAGQPTVPVHEDVMHTLGHIGPDAEAAVLTLRGFLNHPQLAKPAEHALEQIEGK